MADVVDLRSRQPVNHADEFNAELVQDLARYSEGGLISEEEIRRRYQFDDSVWESLADNEKLLAAVADCQTQRVRSGANKREKSQVLVTKAPDVLSGILLDSSANAKHRIDSAKLLNDFSANGPQGAPAADRFVISIILNADDGSAPQTLHFDKAIKPDADGAGGEPTTLHFDKSRAVDVDDSDSNDIAVTPWGMFPAIAAKKPQGGSDGQPI